MIVTDVARASGCPAETTPLASTPGSPSSNAGPRSQTGRAGGASRAQSRPPGPATAPDLNAENLYQLLGVSYTASPAEITRAYRAAMKHVHPDRQRSDLRGAAEEHAKKLNHAYATLSKPIKRRAYDRTIRSEVLQDQLINSYVGGFTTPRTGGQDPSNQSLRRKPTAAERRDQARVDRSALISVVVVFGGLTIGIIVLLLLWSAAQALIEGVF